MPDPDPRSRRVGSTSGRVQNFAEPLIIEDIEDDDSDCVAESATRHVHVCRSPPTKLAPCDMCPCSDPDQGGRVPTPNLKLSDSRHHLDRTTPDSGILIPLTQSTSPPGALSPSPPSPKSRRAVRSSVPNRPPPDVAMCRHSRSPSAIVQPSVPPSCSSPHHHASASADVSSGEIIRQQRSRSPSKVPPPHSSPPCHHRASADVSSAVVTSPTVRRLDFERHVRSKSTTPPKRSVSNHRPLSCQSCGTCLHPATSSASSACIAARHSRPNVEIVKTTSTLVEPRPHQPRPHQSTRTASQQKTNTKRNHTADIPRMGMGVTYPTAGQTGFSGGSCGHLGPVMRSSTYNLRNVDELSLSSSSIASEVLERAKNRRNHFWASQPCQPHE